MRTRIKITTDFDQLPEVTGKVINIKTVTTKKEPYAPTKKVEKIASKWEQHMKNAFHTNRPRSIEVDLKETRRVMSEKPVKNLVWKD